MKKVVIAFDGRHFSEGAISFIQYMNEKQPILVTGVFLPAVDYAELLYSIGGLSGPIYYKETEVDDETLQKNIDRFRSVCENNGIEYRVHPDFDKHVVSELITESRFADLMIISSELFYENLGRETQDNYLENVMHRAECPVILVPERFHIPDNIVLAYDGSASSVYAIKQFCYLFPEFTNMKTLLTFVKTGGADIPDLPYLQEFIPRHYSNLQICKFDIDPATYFNTWLQDNSNPWLVTGAYGRSGLSEMIRKSFIADTIHDHKLPIFIAHK